MTIDLNQILRDLYEEKERIAKVIASLEALDRSGSGDGAASQPSRRGRKSMGPEERREVSERMRKYWAARRTG